MRQQYASGFGFIEAIVAMTIVGILAALAYPSYQSAVRKARRAEARAALLQLMQQEERFYAQNTRYIAFSADSTDADAMRFKWYSGDRPASSAYEITAAACKDETIQACVMLAARPGTDRVSRTFRDSACGVLTLSSAGIRAAAGDAGDCWK